MKWYGPPCCSWERDETTGETILAVWPTWSFDTVSGQTLDMGSVVRLDTVGRARLVEIINAGPPSIEKLEQL